jgi:predicted nucleic acid-binding protein
LRIVADASVALKWLLPAEREADSENAIELLRAVKAGSVGLIQPPHWLAEILAVVARVRPGIVTQAISLLDAMEIDVAADNGVYGRACAIAVDLGQHVFDTLYHAVALEHKATLVTADERYLRKAAALGNIVALNAWAPPAGEPGDPTT